MEEVPLEELMSLVSIMEASLTPLNMQHPIAAGVLELGRNMLIYPTTVYLAGQGAW